MIATSLETIVCVSQERLGQAWDSLGQAGQEKGRVAGPSGSIFYLEFVKTRTESAYIESI